MGGTQETIVAGDFEIQLLLNEEGTLSAKFFSRESQVQEFLQRNGATEQGIGLSYEVDFDTFKEMWQQMFGKKEKEENSSPQNVAPQSKESPIMVMGKDSLIRVLPKNKKLN